jgi:DNA-binding PadR family transcriptional regulator
MLLMSILATNDKLSGYQIAQILSEPVALIWPVRHSQIYPALSALDAAGDLIGQWIEQRGRPNKKTYALADQGKERLGAWLLKSREAFTPDEIMLIAYNVALIGAAAVSVALAAYRRQCEDEIAQLEARWEVAAAAARGFRPLSDNDMLKLVGIRANYDLAIQTRSARIAWCENGLCGSEAIVGSSLA